MFQVELEYSSIYQTGGGIQILFGEQTPEDLARLRTALLDTNDAEIPSLMLKTRAGHEFKVKCNVKPLMSPEDSMIKMFSINFKPIDRPMEHRDTRSREKSVLDIGTFENFFLIISLTRFALWHFTRLAQIVLKIIKLWELHNLLIICTLQDGFRL